VRQLRRDPGKQFLGTNSQNTFARASPYRSADVNQERALVASLPSLLIRIGAGHRVFCSLLVRLRVVNFGTIKCFLVIPIVHRSSTENVAKPVAATGAARVEASDHIMSGQRSGTEPECSPDYKATDVAFSYSFVCSKT
jgi:hypothetical protein